MAERKPRKSAKKAPRRKAAKKKAARKTVKVGKPDVFKPAWADRLRVAEAVAFGFTQDQIALFIRWPRGTKRAGHHVSVDTLQKYFKDEIALGGAELVFNVASNMARTAQFPDPTNAPTVSAGKFILGTIGRRIAPKAGWTEKLDLGLNDGTDIERINAELADIVARLEEAEAISVPE